MFGKITGCADNAGGYRGALSFATMGPSDGQMAEKMRITNGGQLLFSNLQGYGGVSSILISNSNATNLNSVAVGPGGNYGGSSNNPYGIDVGGSAAAGALANPANTALQTTTGDNSNAVYYCAVYNRVRACGGFVSYTVGAVYTGQNYNVHWYIPWCGYMIGFVNVGTTGTTSTPGITNYGSGWWTIPSVNATQGPSGQTGLAISQGAPQWAFYTYGVWLIPNGAAVNQYQTTTVTIIGLANMSSYWYGSFSGVY
jgi:hypothetical protein